MKAVTIDNLDIANHLRWAQDQDALNGIYFSEAQAVAQHPELVGLSMIYSSKFEELFDLTKKNQHWASFSPPKNYPLFGKRFYSHRLLPGIYLEEEEEEGQEEKQEEEGQEKQEDPHQNLIQTVMQIKKMGSQTAVLFEKDKSAMLNLLESIRWLNALINQIHSRKLQYQKG